MQSKLVRNSLPKSVLDDLKELGARLATARKRRGWTQKQMADSLLMGLSSYRRMEQGDPGVSMSHWLQAFHVLGMSWQIKGLLRYEDDREGAMLERDRRVHKKGMGLEDIANSL